MKSNLLSKLRFFLLAILSVASVGYADEKDTLNATDVQFVKREAGAGMAVVSASELGVKKASSNNVKAFAETLVKDHTSANSELKTLATQKGVDTSSVLDPDAASDIKKLEQANGAEFDSKFLAHIISGHKKCVSSFEESSKVAKNADLKAWVDKMLPTLKSHLEKAEALAAK